MTSKTDITKNEHEAGGPDTTSRGYETPVAHQHEMNGHSRSETALEEDGETDGRMPRSFCRAMSRKDRFISRIVEVERLEDSEKEARAVERARVRAQVERNDARARARSWL